MLTLDLCVLVQVHTCAYTDIGHMHVDLSKVNYEL